MRLRITLFLTCAVFLPAQDPAPVINIAPGGTAPGFGGNGIANKRPPLIMVAQCRAIKS